MNLRSAVFSMTLCVLFVASAWGDKNPSGDFFKNGIPPPTQGSGAATGPAVLTAPPPGWVAGKPVLVNPNVRHDLTLNNWMITDLKTGQVVGRWEWDTGNQNFTGTYANGAIDVLRFDEWNNPGHIVLTGFNNLGLRVQFIGELRGRFAEGTATAFVPGNPFTWHWRADTGD